MIGLALWCTLAWGADVPDLYQRSYEQEAAGSVGLALDTMTDMPSAERSAYTYQLRRAWLLYLDGQHEASVQAYRGAVQTAPEAIEPKLGEMLPLMALRRWTETEKLAAEVMKRDPQSYLARSRRAYAVYNLGRYAESEALYRGLVADYPSDVDMRSGLGWALQSQGKEAEAKACFEAVLRVAPKHGSARTGIDG